MNKVKRRGLSNVLKVRRLEVQIEFLRDVLELCEFPAARGKILKSIWRRELAVEWLRKKGKDTVGWGEVKCRFGFGYHNYYHTRMTYGKKKVEREFGLVEK